jgi:pSer/pThr/pTyr-binding forkhead associated (FHA) protein
MGNPSHAQPNSQNRAAFHTAPWRVIVHVGGEPSTAVGLEIATEITVGRADDQTGYMPDLDLLPFGGETAGVSRQHAKICAIDSDLYIIDLGSTNGTRVNDRQVLGDKPTKLNEGDHIEFGNLHVVLNIIRYPG